MQKTAGWLAMSAAAVLVAASVSAAEPGGGVSDAADALLGDIEKAENAEKAEQAKKAEAAAWAEALRGPLWDGKESVADYAKRVGIKDVQTELDLGGGVSMKLTLVPTGKFMMGARPPKFEMIEGVRTMVREGAGGAENDPQLEVIISKPFYMGVYEVTREQWEQVMGRKYPASAPLSPVQLGLTQKQYEQFVGSPVSGGQSREHLSQELLKKIIAADPGYLEYFNCKTHPAERINWEEAAEFCQKVSAKTGRTVSLPTQAQWEYACRAGTDTRFYFGDDDTEMRKYANFNVEGKAGWPKADKETTDGFIGPAPVGSFLPNKWGLYDMHGNVAEWCRDWHGGYKKSGRLDPVGPELPITGHNWHVGLGGGYLSESLFHVWAGSNGGHGPYPHSPSSGFRVVVALK
jgi:formylglycine-generating enzyme required for sulfatase activity